MRIFNPHYSSNPSSRRYGARIFNPLKRKGPSSPGWRGQLRPALCLPLCRLIPTRLGKTERGFPIRPTPRPMVFVTANRSRGARVSNPPSREECGFPIRRAKVRWKPALLFWPALDLTLERHVVRGAWLRACDPRPATGGGVSRENAKIPPGGPILGPKTQFQIFNIPTVAEGFQPRWFVSAIV